MQAIDNGDLTIENISYKIEMIKELIEQLKKEREDDFTNEKERNGITKEIQRISIRLNNYNNKYDHWMDKINKSFKKYDTPHLKAEDFLNEKNL